MNRRNLMFSVALATGMLGNAYADLKPMKANELPAAARPQAAPSDRTRVQQPIVPPQTREQIEKQNEEVSQQALRLLMIRKLLLGFYQEKYQVMQAREVELRSLSWDGGSCHNADVSFVGCPKLLRFNEIYQEMSNDLWCRKHPQKCIEEWSSGKPQELQMETLSDGEWTKVRRDEGEFLRRRDEVLTMIREGLPKLKERLDAANKSEQDFLDSINGK